MWIAVAGWSAFTGRLAPTPAGMMERVSCQNDEPTIAGVDPSELLSIEPIVVVEKLISMRSNGVLPASAEDELLPMCPFFFFFIIQRRACRY